MAEEYLKVGAKELDPDYARVGFHYFADQATGSYTSWPREQAAAWRGPRRRWQRARHTSKGGDHADDITRNAGAVASGGEGAGAVGGGG